MSKLTSQYVSLIHDDNTNDFNECSNDEIYFNINEFEVGAINWDEFNVLQRELRTPGSSYDQDLSILTNENSIEDENNQIPFINVLIQINIRVAAWQSNLKFSYKSKFVRESTNNLIQFQKTQ